MTESPDYGYGGAARGAFDDYRGSSTYNVPDATPPRRHSRGADGRWRVELNETDTRVIAWLEATLLLLRSFDAPASELRAMLAMRRRLECIGCCFEANGINAATDLLRGVSILNPNVDRLAHSRLLAKTRNRGLSGQSGIDDAAAFFTCCAPLLPEALQPAAFAAFAQLGLSNKRMDESGWRTLSWEGIDASPLLNELDLVDVLDFDLTSQEEADPFETKEK